MEVAVDKGLLIVFSFLFLGSVAANFIQAVIICGDYLKHRHEARMAEIAFRQRQLEHAERVMAIDCGRPELAPAQPKQPIERKGGLVDLVLGKKE